VGLRAARAFIEAFREAIQASRGKLGSSRCISHATLLTLAAIAHESVETPALNESSGSRLIQLLQNAGVVRPIPLENATPKKKVRLYAVGFDAIESTIPPAELLQAYVAEGILCYFTALEIHGLTTQPAPHYHIATLRKTSTPSSPPPEHRAKNSDRSPPLGSAQFFSEGIGYYLTRREPRNLIGVQRRLINPFCTVKVTTIEQTLLDCLHRPRNAGGAAVVFEAWGEGISQIDPSKVLDLAMQINDTTLVRRAGYMIERFSPDFQIPSQIRKMAKENLASSEPPSLLAGIPYSRIDLGWHLRIP
jgi:hypothetical protein